jgi:CrcB protein
MTRILLIGLAGAAGTLLRHGVNVWAAGAFGLEFPWATLIVNTLGCFLIAFVMQIALSTTYLPDPWRIALTTGFMGGLTTYSSYNQDTMTMLRERGATSALANVGTMLVVCFAAGWLGLWLARRVAAG